MTTRRPEGILFLFCFVGVEMCHKPMLKPKSSHTEGLGNDQCKVMMYVFLLIDEKRPSLYVLPCFLSGGDCSMVTSLHCSVFQRHQDPPLGTSKISLEKKCELNSRPGLVFSRVFCLFGGLRPDFLKDIHLAPPSFFPFFLLPH